MFLSEISGFLDNEGRLTALPNKRRKKIVALSYLADRISAGQSFSEQDFNTLLNTLHTFGDAATLRREMFDYYFINREKTALIIASIPIAQPLKHCLPSIANKEKK